MNTKNQQRDQRAKDLFCKILGATNWKYRQSPTYFYHLWESYLKNGESRSYPWDQRTYKEQRESDMLMCKTIHQIYLEATGINFRQLTLEL